MEISTRLRLPGDRLAQDFFREAVGVNIGGVEEVDAGVEADIDKAGGLVSVGSCPTRLKELVAAAESSRAEAERGDFSPE